MKKKIIITALSLMIASSTIIPAYAALPEGAPYVDIYTEGGRLNIIGITNSLHTWADQYVDELNGISDVRTRYRRICELVATNFKPLDRFVTGDEVVTTYNEGMLGQSSICSIILYLSNQTGIEAKSGSFSWMYSTNPAIAGDIEDTVYLQLDGQFYYTIPGNIFDIELFDECYLIQDGNRFGTVLADSITHPEKYAQTTIDYTFQDIDNPITKTAVVFYTPNKELIPADVRATKNYPQGVTSFYRYENGVLTPMSREEAVILGYEGIF